jgi:hypothetical protein
MLNKISQINIIVTVRLKIGLKKSIYYYIISQFNQLFLLK